ncbi:hypothetical protein C2U70_17355, partial [Bradyrhizobium guangdongense]
AIHDLSRSEKNVDARDKPGHDEFLARACRTMENRICDSPAVRRGNRHALAEGAGACLGRSRQ